MSFNALYTDLSDYYDLMCADINYYQQSASINRLHTLFGQGGTRHLDLACGTGPHVKHFSDFLYQSSGLDINQPMLDIATLRCPHAQFSLQDMCHFSTEDHFDLITCFLYSIHYSGNTQRLQACIRSTHAALSTGGVFCFNAVDKDKIDNFSFVKHSVQKGEDLFTFASKWHYKGKGDTQTLDVHIEKTNTGETQYWQDSHPMVAIGFAELTQLLAPYFNVQMFEHDYDKILPWDGKSGNAIFACVKI